MSVSAALSGTNGSTKLSDSTRERIKEAAETLGYTPNAIARSLRRQKTDVIGFYFGHGQFTARLPFLAEIIGGIQEGCAQHKQDLLLHFIMGGRSLEDVYSSCMSGQIDGLIVLAPPGDPLIALLQGGDLPVMAVVDAIQDIPSVVADDLLGAQLIAEYLHAKGHKKVIYRSLEKLHLVSAVRRRDAFLEAATRLNMSVEECELPQVTLPGDSRITSWLCNEVEERPTAVICWNDEAGYDLLHHCHRHKVKVPEDLAIIGFDGLSTPLESMLVLTSVRAPWAEVARTAVELLCSRIAGKEVAKETVLPVQMLIGTTG